MFKKIKFNQSHEKRNFPRINRHQSQPVKNRELEDPEILLDRYLMLFFYQVMLYILLNISLFYLIEGLWKWREARRNDRAHKEARQALSVDLWV